MATILLDMENKKAIKHLIREAVKGISLNGIAEIKAGYEEDGIIDVIDIIEGYCDLSGKVKVLYEYSDDTYSYNENGCNLVETKYDDATMTLCEFLLGDSEIEYKGDAKMHEFLLDIVKARFYEVA